MSKGEIKNLNAQVKRSDGSQVVCRHLAYAFATGQFGTEASGKFSGINKPNKISQHSGIPTEEKLSEVFNHKRADEGYYFDRDSGFGQALQTILRRMPKNGRPKSYQLFSPNHAMAITLSIPKGQQGIRMAFYDPNNTLCIHRFIIPSIEAASTLSLEDLMSKAHIKAYFPEKFSAGVFLSTSVKEKQGDCHVEAFGNASPMIDRQALEYGHYGHKNLAFLFEPVDTDALIVTSDNGLHGLSLALQRGHTESIRHYLDKLLSSRLNNTAIKELLMAENNDKVPGLYMAMQNNHSKTVKIYLSKVLDSELDNQSKRELAAAKADDGVPGLSIALHEGLPESVKTYMTLITCFV